MLSPALLAALLALPAPAAPDAPCVEVGPVPVLAAAVDRTPARADDELRATYEQGRSYRDFLGAATRRAETWHGNTEQAAHPQFAGDLGLEEQAAAIDPALVARARALGGTWRFLAVAVDSCSDSVSTIPYLAELVARVEGLDMRIVDASVGRAIMESHRTPDGRPSTPTVLLLDAEWEERGCFIERPPALQTWILEEGFSADQVFANKMRWYAEDAGQNTVEAFVEMLEAATRGETICR